MAQGATSPAEVTGRKAFRVFIAAQNRRQQAEITLDTRLDVESFLDHKFTAEAMTKTQKDRNFELFEIQTILGLHQMINNPDNYYGRRVLYRDVEPALVKAANAALQEIGGSERLSQLGQMNPKFITANFSKNAAALCAFSNLMAQPLEGQNPSPLGPSPLDVVERLLLDFDLLAILHTRKNSIAKQYIDGFFSVLERSAPKIVPFVLIQRRLRGAPNYKHDYMELLQAIRIIRADGSVVNTKA